jgi:hypothetical protein
MSLSSEPVPASTNARRTLIWVLIIAAAALAASSPALLRGSPEGNDFSFHFNLWLDAAKQWRQGVWLPRWADRAEGGFGEPAYLFYPPASWTMGALLVMSLPPKAVAAAYLFIAMFAAGISMFIFARDWMTEPCAAMVAIVYIGNPYLLLCAYIRSAQAELLTIALLPLIMRVALRLSRGSQAVAPLALCFAAAWLTDFPSAIVVTYALALTIVLVAVVASSIKPLAYGAMAMALGFGLAAFCIVPAAYERSWVNIRNVLYFSPSSYFLLDWKRSAATGWLTARVSLMALIQIGLLALAIFLRARRHDRALLRVLAPLGIASALMMFPVSSLAWRHLPELAYVQFPWRWLAVVTFCSSFMLFAALQRTRGVLLMLLALLLVVLGAAMASWKAPWHLNAPVRLQEAFNSGGFFGVPEYLPVGATPEMLKNSQADRAQFVDRVQGELFVSQWEPERKSVVVDASAPAQIALRVLSYPAWRARVNESPIVTTTDPRTGQILVKVPAGHSQIELRFARTPDRILGTVISALAVLFIAVLAWKVKQRQPPSMH